MSRAENGSLAITISDNGPGPSPEAARPGSVGIGLSNTRRRLEVLYPGAYRFELVTADHGGGEVRLHIPPALVPRA
jgi:sensor histidine kinase YesM